eukprot:6266112-Alexandrium_andersonii.AAC.1
MFAHAPVDASARSSDGQGPGGGQTAPSGWQTNEETWGEIEYLAYRSCPQGFPHVSAEPRVAAAANSDPNDDPYCFLRFKAREGKRPQADPPRSEWREWYEGHTTKRIGWPLPYQVADQFGDIAGAEKRRKTQGIKY